MNFPSIISWIIIILIFIWRIRKGFKNGFVGEVTSTISIIVAFIVARILFLGVVAFVEKQLGKVLCSLIILALVMAVFAIVKLILKALKLFSKLPIINGVDKLLGILAGGVEAFLIVVFMVEILELWI